jgi:two-component system, OmpR family, copper resistance phosphate regulon response regulator CusR
MLPTQTQDRLNFLEPEPTRPVVDRVAFLLNGRSEANLWSGRSFRCARIAAGGAKSRERELSVMARVLVVEDQKKHLDSLRRGLEAEGYEVTTASTGEAGLQLAISEKVDAIVLDLMLPGRDGLTILRELRSRGFAMPILVLTARDSVEDRVRGLDEGASDYLVKPFAFAEFLARLRALLRRDLTGPPLFLRAGDLEMDLLGRRVSRGGETLELTGREYELLEYLLRHKNEVVTRDMIALDVWKETTGAMTRVIDVYINALRKKVDRTGRVALIQTVRGVGYALRESL